VAGGEVQRRWPRRRGERQRGGEIGGNKRAWEFHGCLVKLLEQWDDGERGRRAPAPGGGGNGDGGSGLARGEARGAFICGLARPRVTRRDGGDAPVPRRIRARAYDGDTADGPAVRGVRARTTALTSGRLGTGCVGERGLGMVRASGGVGLGRRGRGRRGTAGGAPALWV
jgi:hypothetical protein